MTESNPTNAPPAAPPSEGAGAPADAGVDWNSFTLDAPEDSSPGVAPATDGRVAGPAAPVAPAAAPAGDTQAQGAAPTEPVAVPQIQPVTPAVAQPPAEGAQGAPLPDVFDPQFQEQQRTALAQSYALDEALAELVQSDPVQAIPQMAANLHMRMRYEMAHFMDMWQQSILPQIIESAFKGRDDRATAQSTIEEKVFSKYERLKEVPLETLTAFSSRIAAAMPQAKPEERIAALARAAYAMYGWQLPGSKPPASQQPPAQQGAPAVVPWMPVAPGAAPPPPARANGQTGNPWIDSGMVDER